MTKTQEHINYDVNTNLDDIEKLQAMFETRSEINNDELDLKEFTYANDDEDDDGNWWLMLAVAALTWSIFGIIGVIKVVQWIIQLIKHLAA